jgi:hypothetical protein
VTLRPRTRNLLLGLADGLEAVKRRGSRRPEVEDGGFEIALRLGDHGVDGGGLDVDGRGLRNRQRSEPGYG